MVLARLDAAPQIVNDGVTIAKEIEVADPEVNIGVRLIQEVAKKSGAWFLWVVVLLGCVKGVGVGVCGYVVGGCAVCWLVDGWMGSPPSVIQGSATWQAPRRPANNTQQSMK